MYTSAIVDKMRSNFLNTYKLDAQSSHNRLLCKELVFEVDCVYINAVGILMCWLFKAKLETLQ